MALSDPNNKSKIKISNLSSDCLMLILQLRATNEYGDAENLRKKVIELL